MVAIPGDPGYTPMWKVSIVEWKTNSGITPTILGSDDAIAAAQSKGQITITPTNVVVNCPILGTPALELGIVEKIQPEQSKK
jgi:hypothetical protein